MVEENFETPRSVWSDGTPTEDGIPVLVLTSHADGIVNEISFYRT